VTEERVVDATDTDVTDTDVTDTDVSDADAGQLTDEFGLSPSKPPGRRIGRLVAAAALVVVLLASAGLATWLYFYQLRPDQQTNGTVAAQTVKAANDGAVALLSYAPGTMDQDFTAAKSHLTGGFLNYYSQFTHDIVAPAVQQKAVKTSATIVQSAVSELHPDSAVVLVFLNQTTTSKENPNGSFTASSVKVGLTKVDGSWLISAFDPV
jgi:Mce-associated membrane protein